MSEFSADVSAWVAKSRKRLEMVFKESAQRVIAEMQTPVSAGGNMPVDTGFLRASLQAALNSPPSSVIVAPPESGSFNYSSSEVALVIASANIGDVIYATYGANYAAAVEYGRNGRPGRAFRRLAAQRWKRIVREVSAEAKARVN